jgi:hypothetical protein
MEQGIGETAYGPVKAGSAAVKNFTSTTASASHGDKRASRVSDGRCACARTRALEITRVQQWGAAEAWAKAGRIGLTAAADHDVESAPRARRTEVARNVCAAAAMRVAAAGTAGSPKSNMRSNNSTRYEGLRG